MAVLAFTAASASAASLLVDDDAVDCPAATYSKIQTAVDAAATGDTVVICPGTYAEGAGTPGTNALTINKDLIIKGAGADLVTISPKRSTATGGQIASNSPVLRDGVGNIVAVTGGTLFPVKVDISGVTVKGNGVVAEAGILFLDAKGSVVRSRVTGIVTSERAEAFDQPGGFRSSDTGYGIVQATAATSPPAGGAVARPLAITTTRVDQYNKTGILIDGATGDTPPLTSAGVANTASIVGTTVVGRLRCIDYIANGNCSTVGTLTTGPLFGQDGLKVTAGAKVSMDSSSIFQNYVNGVGSPVFSPNTGTPLSTNNANLSMAAGVRLIGAGASTITRSNIADNHFGAFNVGLDGSTANTATPLSAENNWWGARTTGLTYNNGPAVSPTTNPAQQENPVNGTATVDPTCVAKSLAATPAADTTVPGSDAVDFCPYRNGARSDATVGQVAITDAPIPISDAPPTTTLVTDKATYERGETAVLTATPSDDFAIKKVTFYKGAEVIGTASVPPYSTDIAIPADAACATTTYSAVVEDSDGQTGSATADVTVVEANNCIPPVDPPALPTIRIDAPASIPNTGATVTATVTAEAGVKSVDFFLGTRPMCSVTAAPYACFMQPNGGNVGGQSIRAVVTDDLDRTAEASSTTSVDKFTAKLSWKKVTRPSKTKRTITGAITLPAFVTPEQACTSGSVTLIIKGGGRPTINRQVSVAADCGFKATVGIGKAKKPKNGKKPKKRTFTIKGNYGGNSVLNSATNSRRFS